TVTFTAADVDELPATSRTRTDKAYAPFARVRVSQRTTYGEVVSSAPTAWPLTSSCVPPTSTLSAAVIDTFTTPETVAPFAGEATEPVGLVVSKPPPIGVLMSAPISGKVSG